MLKDYDLFWRMAKFGKTMNLNEPLYFLRKTGESISSTKGVEQMIYDQIIKNKNSEKSYSANQNHIRIQKSNMKLNKDSIIRNGDESLLAGRYIKSARMYLKLFYYFDLIALSKFIRLLIWIFFPFIRYKLFSTPHEPYRQDKK